jgi:transposase
VRVWRPHSREFKLHVVRQLITGEKSRAQICREHELAEGVVSRWKHDYLQRGEEAFAVKRPSETEALTARVAELERFCGQLALENAALKKTLQTPRLSSDTR